MNELKIFENKEFGAIRTVMIKGEPWLIGRDVAQALGYGNPRQALKTNVDEEDKGVHLVDTLGGSQEVTIINESGLYSLVLSSKLPNAKKFKHWVTSEVLPSIRKHGAYMTPQTLEQALTNPDFLIQLATKLKEEREARKALEAKVEADKPKVLFAEAVTASDTSILIRDYAKILRQNGIETGERRLYKWFRENGYIIKGSTQPTQKAMELELFEVVERSIQRGEGLPRVTSTTRVTGKGQVYFLDKIKKGMKQSDSEATSQAV